MMDSKGNHEIRLQRNHRTFEKACIEADLFQQAVADKLGKPQYYISKIESGERRLDVAEMNKFTTIYNKPVDYFFEIK